MPSSVQIASTGTSHDATGKDSTCCTANAAPTSQGGARGRGGRRSCDHTSRPHAQPAALCVETHQWGHDQRHPFRFQGVFHGHVRLGDAIAVAGQRLPGPPWCEAQHVAGQHRQAVGESFGQLQLPAVQGDFAIQRPVAGHGAFARANGRASRASASDSAAAMRSPALRSRRRCRRSWRRAWRGSVMAASGKDQPSLCRKEQGRRPKTPPLLEYCILRNVDACETTLNPGLKWERWRTIGLPATRRTCTPGAVALPVSFLRDKANVCTCRRVPQRTRGHYSQHAGSG